MARVENSARNAFTGVMGQAVTFLMSFLGRLVFVYTLGQEYLGISGWFTNILSILGISELGIGTAIVVSLYAPLASGDKERIRATMRLMRRAYFLVGLAILALGLLLLPFLPVLVKEKTELVDLNIVYLMFLAQSVFSYMFLSYKGAVLTADQKQYRINILQCAVSIATTAAQIAALLIFGSYYAYVGIFVLSVILKNLLTARAADGEYPYIKSLGTAPELPREEKRSIFKNLVGLSLYRVSGTVLNATDSIVLGKFIGFAIIGLYSNYLLVITALTTVLSLLFRSFTASVGHLNVTADPARKAFIFRCLNLLDGWLYGFCAICLYVLIDPFITVFFGPEWVFADPLVKPIIALNFLTSGLLENVIMHKDACGLFWQGRLRPVFSAGLNILFSILLVGPMGIAGVLLATVISRLMTTWWFDPWMVHRYALNESSRHYFMQTLMVLLMSAICAAGLDMLSCLVLGDPSGLSLALMLPICLVVPNIMFYAVFGKTDEFAHIRRTALDMIKGKLRRGEKHD